MTYENAALEGLELTTVSMHIVTYPAAVVKSITYQNATRHMLKHNVAFNT